METGEVDIGDDLNAYVLAIVANGGATMYKKVLAVEAEDSGDPGGRRLGVQHVMPHVALRVAGRLLGVDLTGDAPEYLTDDFEDLADAPEELADALAGLTPAQWRAVVDHMVCTEWVPCVACALPAGCAVRPSAALPGHALWQRNDWDGATPCARVDRLALVVWVVPVHVHAAV
jgi:hypothetical protein